MENKCLIALQLFCDMKWLSSFLVSYSYLKELQEPLNLTKKYTFIYVTMTGILRVPELNLMHPIQLPQVLL